MPKDRGEPKEKRRRIRDFPANFIARTPWLRKRYAKRLVRTLKKSREKGRQMPEGLGRLERQIRHLPPAKQAQTIEEALEFSAVGKDAQLSRELRRATERSNRQSGRSKGGVRPGMAPGQRSVPGQKKVR